MSFGYQKVRSLTCCCCGEDAGRWAQHWNRDYGYGVCVRCVTHERMRGTSEEEITSSYGTEGKNWGMSIEICGHCVQVLAAFREEEKDKANAWMLGHEGHSLLATRDGLLLIAHEKDMGTPVATSSTGGNV